ncbi:hypothetical protein A3F58_02385 [Candidatus Roizmanbacteria bacterium RIFCSPHIGHO2_12_FULL_37_9b]|uniref:Peptidase A2 domain-containing protein n=1 Tax=Candidatus Roizmanbacteria bacterium RIFCSPHIGHO2_02_FULL_38_11 TaxID=1802039 RepID=A0A1F7H310_9BACT|nr:MAG: hypothetical protein A3C25_00600 [Candidatus Roizmanbacteria bacterium RIFCSPHIGHO2_02_FULL_38_11]OGK34600.1 MAG: hypothetical protein A3F58_02385 [Candidatus Roizmanbacteria bacterium RIFCSPHIGHO2_12_FULL_37_9b]
MKIFSYKKDARGNLYPIIEVYLSSGNKTANIFTLVDSGASISVFTTEVAKQLDIKVEKGKETYLGGVGGRIKGYIHNLQLKISKKEITAPVIFSHEYLVSFNLLGRDGVFKHFRIQFEEKDLVTKFEDV